MKKIEITELKKLILKELELAGFKKNTRGFYEVLLNRLRRLSVDEGVKYYTEELGQKFITDDSHINHDNTERYYHDRTLSYIRTIKFIESYLKYGYVEYGPAHNYAMFPLKSSEMRSIFDKYDQELSNRRLKQNTIEGYRRFVFYFLDFLENKGYISVLEMTNGDVIAFITLICSERYQPTSLGAHIAGLKILLLMQCETQKYLNELPKHLPKKREILQIYSEEEYNQIMDYIGTSENISLRNRALTIIALDTGLRAVDICNLKLSDIDWEHNFIHITQEKTKRSLYIPLSENIGNAIVDYLLNERPVSNSDFAFLKSVAPFKPLMSHSGIRKILFNVVNDTDIKSNGRTYGTRITRHSTASRMLKKGIPLSVISEALGHGNPNSVLIYLTTDNAKLAECTLPLPKGGELNE